MVVRINRLWDAEIRAALTHGFQITVKAFILCQEKSDDLPGSIIDSTMKGVFDISPKPLVRRGIDLDELSGMGLTFAPMCAVSDFFLFTGKSRVGKLNSEICREYIFEMEEVGIREFWAGINLKDSFLQFVRNGVNGFSTGIFMNEGLSARGKDSFL